MNQPFLFLFFYLLLLFFFHSGVKNHGEVLNGSVKSTECCLRIMDIFDNDPEH